MLVGEASSLELLLEELHVELRVVGGDDSAVEPMGNLR